MTSAPRDHRVGRVTCRPYAAHEAWDVGTSGLRYPAEDSGARTRPAGSVAVKRPRRPDDTCWLYPPGGP